MSGDLQNAYFNLQVAYDLMQQYHKEKINLEMQKVDVGRKRVMQENKILAKNNTILWMTIALIFVSIIGAGILIAYKRRNDLHKRQLELIEK